MPISESDQPVGLVTVLINPINQWQTVAIPGWATRVTVVNEDAAQPMYLGDPREVGALAIGTDDLVTVRPQTGRTLFWKQGGKARPADGPPDLQVASATLNHRIVVICEAGGS